MSADYCAYVLAIADDKTPNWDVEITPESLRTYCQDILGMTDEEILEKGDDSKQDLQEAIANLKDAWENEYDCCKIHFPQFKCIIFTTGGMTWGDSPTDTFEAISVLAYAGLLFQIGFEE